MSFWKKHKGADAQLFKVAIDPDDYHARDVGWTKEGKQFFLTTPFRPALGGAEGGEYLALYVFDSDGVLYDSRITSLGVRGAFDATNAKQQLDELRRSLGEVDHRRIEIYPFSVEHDGEQFGLVLREPEDEEDCYAVEAQPGNYMAFFEPWDSGEYDT